MAARSPYCRVEPPPRAGVGLSLPWACFFITFLIVLSRHHFRSFPLSFSVTFLMMFVLGGIVFRIVSEYLFNSFLNNFVTARSLKSYKSIDFHTLLSIRLFRRRRMSGENPDQFVGHQFIDGLFIFNFFSRINLDIVFSSTSS